MKKWKTRIKSLAKIRHVFSKQDRLYYFDKFKTWKQAEERAKKYGDAYEGENILQRVADSTQKVRNGEAVYEQDGVAYYEENNNYELISCLLYAYAMKGALDVFDFGGALGSTFFRYRSLLESIKVNWTIIEQPHFVEYGKENVPEVNFSYDISECNAKGNVILLSSVLGYLEDTYKTFEILLAQDAKFIIIDELAFSPDDKEIIMLQHVPSSIYQAVYPIRLLSLSKFKQFLRKNKYTIVWEWDYRFGCIPIFEGLKITDTLEKGFFLERLD